MIIDIPYEVAVDGIAARKRTRKNWIVRMTRPVEVKKASAIAQGPIVEDVQTWVIDGRTAVKVDFRDRKTRRALSWAEAVREIVAGGSPATDHNPTSIPSLEIRELRQIDVVDVVPDHFRSEDRRIEAEPALNAAVSAELVVGPDGDLYTTRFEVASAIVKKGFGPEQRRPVLVDTLSSPRVLAKRHRDLAPIRQSPTSRLDFDRIKACHDVIRSDLSFGISIPYPDRPTSFRYGIEELKEFRSSVVDASRGEHTRPAAQLVLERKLRRKRDQGDAGTKIPVPSRDIDGPTFKVYPAFASGHDYKRYEIKAPLIDEARISKEDFAGRSAMVHEGRVWLRCGEPRLEEFEENPLLMGKPVPYLLQVGNSFFAQFSLSPEPQATKLPPPQRYVNMDLRSAGMARSIKQSYLPEAKTVLDNTIVTFDEKKKSLWTSRYEPVRLEGQPNIEWIDLRTPPSSLASLRPFPTELPAGATSRFPFAIHRLSEQLRSLAASPYGARPQPQENRLQALFLGNFDPLDERLDDEVFQSTADLLDVVFQIDADMIETGCTQGVAPYAEKAAAALQRFVAAVEHSNLLERPGVDTGLWPSVRDSALELAANMIHSEPLPEDIDAEDAEAIASLR